jgi:hypothetical protein
MKEDVLIMHHIPACTTFITTVITATGGTCDDTQQLHASVTRAAQAAAARGGQRGSLPARVRDQAAALANLLIVLELLDPDGAAAAPPPVLAGWAALWRALDAHGLTTPAWSAVFQGLLTGPSLTQRWAACQQPGSALAYARRVDRAAHDQTRAAACASPTAAVLYAWLLDRGPHPETQAAAGQQPATAEQYAVLMAALHALAGVTPSGRVLAARAGYPAVLSGLYLACRQRGGALPPYLGADAVSFLRLGSVVIAQPTPSADREPLWQLPPDAAQTALLTLNGARLQQALADGPTTTRAVVLPVGHTTHWSRRPVPSYAT